MINPAQNGYLARAQSLFKLEAWDDLAELLQPLLQVVENAPLWSLQYGGAAAFHLGRLQQAELLLRRAYCLRPDEGWTSYFLGRIALRNGVFAEAVSCLGASVVALPNERWPSFFLLDALLQQGDWKAAHSILSRLLPFWGELPGLNLLCQRWMSLVRRSGSTPPVIGRHISALRLPGGRWLLLGWSTAQNLVMDLRNGAIDVGNPDSQFQIDRFAGQHGRGWAVLWIGARPADGWFLHGTQQQPEQLDIEVLDWPVSAYRLLECTQNAGLQQRDLTRSLSGWLGSSLKGLRPTSVRLTGLPLGVEVFELGGSIPGSPELSVVLPLDSSWDLLRVQLMQLASEPLMRTCQAELVVVLDDPTSVDDLLTWCRCTGEAFGLPFRLIVHSSRLGFAQACNSGAVVARGRALLLQKPDVLPRCSGWLQLLLTALLQDEHTALVSPLLLDADGAVLAAGIEVVDDPVDPGRQCLKHPGRGLRWQAGVDPRRVSFLELHSWLVDRAHFLELGGLSGSFLGAGGEDLMFCRRLQASSLEALLVPAVEMIQAARVSLLDRKIDLPKETRSFHKVFDRVNLWLALQQDENEEVRI